MSPVQRFNLVPKDIEGVLQCLDFLADKVETMEKNFEKYKDEQNTLMKEHKDVQNEMKVILSKLEKKALAILTAFIIALGAKYGLDLTGIAI